MLETCVFRVQAEYAHRLFRPEEGKYLGGSIRNIEIATDDPRFECIGQIRAELLEQRGEYFFLGWDYRRRYSESELNAAEMFHLRISHVFEPAGEDCGTAYNESTACRICGSGRKQISELRLDLRKAPRAKGLARTIADEWIVSQSLAESLTESGMTGFELHPVRHKARYDADSIDLRRYPSGRMLIERAEKVGITPFSWEFWVWSGCSEQRNLDDQLTREHCLSMNKKDSQYKLPRWHQLVVTSKPISMVAPTRCGNDPFDNDENNEYRCPLGHICGLNFLSEVFVSRDEWDGSDVTQTHQTVGRRAGVLVPAPLLLISPRLWRLLRDRKHKGWDVEVAYLRTE